MSKGRNLKDPEGTKPVEFRAREENRTPDLLFTSRGSSVHPGPSLPALSGISH